MGTIRIREAHSHTVHNRGSAQFIRLSFLSSACLGLNEKCMQIQKIIAQYEIGPVRPRWTIAVCNFSMRTPDDHIATIFHHSIDRICTLFGYMRHFHALSCRINHGVNRTVLRIFKRVFRPTPLHIHRSYHTPADSPKFTD